MNLDQTNFAACEATRGLSGITIAKLASAIEQGIALVSAWQLSDEDFVQSNEATTIGCGCGCVPID
jgi:hypothetical protein